MVSICNIIIHSPPFMSLRESLLLTREIEELKSKLITKTNELSEAIKSNSEVLLCSKKSC